MTTKQNVPVGTNANSKRPLLTIRICLPLLNAISNLRFQRQFKTELLEVSVRVKALALQLFEVRVLLDRASAPVTMVSYACGVWACVYVCRRS